MGRMTKFTSPSRASLPLFLALALSVASATASARTLSVQPLNGSAWAKQNPGQLPYEKCRIVHNFGTAGLKPIWGEASPLLFYGQERVSDAFGTTALFCWSKKLKLGFSIPVQFSKIQRGGLDVAFGDMNFAAETWLSQLDGKSVQDLFGRYKGAEGGLGVVIGFNYRNLRNASGVRFQQFSGRILAGGVAGYVTFELSAPQQNTILDQGYTLTSDPSTSSPGWTWGRREIDWNQLFPLRFIKVR